MKLLINRAPPSPPAMFSRTVTLSMKTIELIAAIAPPLASALLPANMLRPTIRPPFTHITAPPSTALPLVKVNPSIIQNPLWLFKICPPFPLINVESEPEKLTNNPDLSVTTMFSL